MLGLQLISLKHRKDVILQNQLSLYTDCQSCENERKTAFIRWGQNLSQILKFKNSELRPSFWSVSVLLNLVYNLPVQTFVKEWVIRGHNCCDEAVCEISSLMHILQSSIRGLLESGSVQESQQLNHESDHKKLQSGVTKCVKVTKTLLDQ